MRGITKAMQEKALREESLLKGGAFWPPVDAVGHVAKVMFEHYCAELGVDPSNWDGLSVSTKQLELRNGAWLIGRLAHEGYFIVKRK